MESEFEKFSKYSFKYLVPVRPDSTVFRFFWKEVKHEKEVNKPLQFIEKAELNTWSYI